MIQKSKVLSFISQDLFIDLPHSAQALFLHILMNTDEHGECFCAKSLARALRAAKDDLELLYTIGVIDTRDGCMLGSDINGDLV